MNRSSRGHNRGESGSYYFLGHEPGTTEAVRDDDNITVIEEVPRGSSIDAFAPRMLSTVSHNMILY